MGGGDKHWGSDDKVVCHVLGPALGKQQLRPCKGVRSVYRQDLP